MKGEPAEKLYQVAEGVTDTPEQAEELYNILEGYVLQYLEDIKD
jgi:hypothetical protein